MHFIHAVNSAEKIFEFASSRPCQCPGRRAVDYYWVNFFSFWPEIPEDMPLPAKFLIKCIYFSQRSLFFKHENFSEISSKKPPRIGIPFLRGTTHLYRKAYKMPAKERTAIWIVIQALKKILQELCVVLHTGGHIIRAIKVLKKTCANLVSSANLFTYSWLDVDMSSAEDAQDGTESSFSLYY